MLDILIVLLILAWLTGNTIFHIGSIIHVLLVIAVVVILVRVIQGRRVL